MDRMFAIASAVVADAIRKKVVWVVVVFAALLALAIPALPSYGVGVIAGVFREVTISLMFAATFVVALALAALRIPAEVERRTVFNVLSRDVRRWQYVVGSWLGIFVVIGASLAAFTGIAVLVGALVYGKVMVVLFAAGLAVLYEMGIIAAFTVMMSTRVGAVTSIVGAIAFTFVGHSIQALVAPSLERLPWYIPSLEVFNVIDPVSYGSGFSLGYGLAITASFVAWIALLLLGASALFERRDL
jgi:ABC-type transport system involved in multi-copper enzyme maturation permease subunit